MIVPCRVRASRWARNRKKIPQKLFSIILDPALNREVHQIQLFFLESLEEIIYIYHIFAMLRQLLVTF